MAMGFGLERVLVALGPDKVRGVVPEGGHLLLFHEGNLVRREAAVVVRLQEGHGLVMRVV